MKKFYKKNVTKNCEPNLKLKAMAFKKLFKVLDRLNLLS